jgi:hypothetical protein
MAAPAARISLTRTQRTSQIGAELLSLCQTVTADGSLNDEEVSSLREWLTAHAASDLPAIRFLAPIVERILADGVVNTAERRELYLAVEKVLPPDARGLARAARMASEWTGRQDQEGPHRQHTHTFRSCCRTFQARREGRAIDSRCGAACEAFRPRDSPVGRSRLSLFFSWRYGDALRHREVWSAHEADVQPLSTASVRIRRRRTGAFDPELPLDVVR